MRDLDNRRSLPRRAHGRGLGPTELGRRDIETPYWRHFPDVATNIKTPERVTVDLTPYGEREVLDGRD